MAEVARPGDRYRRQAQSGGAIAAAASDSDGVGDPPRPPGVFDKAGIAIDNEALHSLLRRIVRPLAGALVLAVALASSAECLTAAQMTPDQHACCAAMKGACEMAVGAPCCASDATDSTGFLAIKPTLAPTPVAVLVAVLSVPRVVAVPVGHADAAPDASALGPPGVPTYLFVSSFRI